MSSETAPSATSNQTASAEERYFAFGPDSGKIDFIGSKVTGKHDGGFRQFAGEFRVLGDKIADTGSKIVIATDSIWSDNGRLTQHLKSPDFFDVAQYPTALFVSSAVSPDGAAHTISGSLTLHGITKQISFPAQISVTDGQVKVQAEFSLNRFDFDMKYAGKADDMIRKEVVLKLDIAASPGRADFSTVEKATQAAIPASSAFASKLALAAP